MYREGAVIPKLVAALNRLDYPKAKLDIKFVIESGDEETLAAIRAERLPPRYDVIVAPPGQPRTKPRALNVALDVARGDLLCVYDAEDEPAPDQLRRAAARFAADSRLDALQGKLTIANWRDCWLSFMFAVEYAALFDLINPGLAGARSAGRARRHDQPFPHRDRCAGSAAGTPGTSPRTPISACVSPASAPASARSNSRPSRRRRTNSATGSASARAGRRAGCRR